MSYSTPSDDVILELFQSSKTIAVVGCSPNPSRTSHQIARSMQAYGYKIIPVHP
ncbi:CoA-binding protein, partial [Myxococcota bacterium]|nr:CoA-binding protein [Myxococcota bacterium]